MLFSTILSKEKNDGEALHGRECKRTELLHDVMANRICAQLKGLVLRRNSM